MRATELQCINRISERAGETIKSIEGNISSYQNYSQITDMLNEIKGSVEMMRELADAVLKDNDFKK